MRKVNLDEYMRELKPRAAQAYLQAAAAWGRPLPRRRPRAAAEEAILAHLDRLRRQKALADGTLVQLATRRYRLRIW
ncbi:MAG: hypothetical protein ACOY9Y_14600 [Bacillota bacterium]